MPPIVGLRIVAGTTVWPGSHIRLQRTLPNEQACGFVANEAYTLERDAIIEQVRRLTALANDMHHTGFNTTQYVANRAFIALWTPTEACKSSKYSYGVSELLASLTTQSLDGDRFDQLRSQALVGTSCFFIHA